jgi:hypothetical protein
MRMLRNLLILGATAASLSGCAWFNVGPCYGVGCPAHVTSNSQADQTKSSATVAAPKPHKVPPQQPTDVAEPPNTIAAK